MTCFVSFSHYQRLALRRLVDVSMGVITPLSEQLTKPLPNAIVLATLQELSTGADKLLPKGTRLVVSVRGDETQEQLEYLKSSDATMIFHDLPYTEEKVGRVQAARRLFEYLSEHCLDFPVIHHIHFPKGTHRDDLVIGAGTNAGALLVDGLGDGILLEAPDQDFDFLRNTSFNLLQGCRMRNTKTVGIMRVPNSAEKSLKEVMEEIMGDHEMMDFAFVDDDVDGGWMISQ
ncbi:(E)-4-hydroxy-3-methylbut-2-enyl diphosphate synthase [Heracleum sosnowskyi]|uniref:(E)-4-hydroxy-3-methylbut-2-enyl diphosphate synthase n=1 Tax=Heracleum sosnowskyi TaxID=360622 RepID=A0AAD8MQ56_9APIA|nr:(E)-4-hydroxy-3-methylbut-2-enyl diphosphate synthase [Heracleum sosnowskyi]